jgi:hypothetical protein
MRVKIGPFVDWLGPHQIADAVFFWLEKYPEEGDEDRLVYKLRDKLSEFLAGKNNSSKLHAFCQWLHDKRKRKVVVKLDHYDHWNAGHTLALVILPVLKALKEHKHGSPDVEFGDVPENLWPKQPASFANNYTDDTVHERWAWVLDEIIWTFEQEIDDDSESQFYDHTDANDPNDNLMTQVGKIKINQEGLDFHNERRANGFRLFGKYYQALWD